MAGRRFRSQFFVNHREFIEFKLEKHGSLNVPIEHQPTIRYMVYNGYYKVMSNIPKMGQLPTPENNQQNLGFLSWENLNLKISPKLWRLQERPGKAQSPRCNSRKINRLWLCSSQINQVLCLNLTWLVVSIPLKNISQWEGLFHILWKKMFETTNQ